jgi:hypothetical protein
MSRPVRILLAAILLAALIVGAVAIVVPLIARPMIVAAVQGASPFQSGPLDVEVDCNVFGLLTGTVDRIHVRGANLRRGDATIEALDITLTDVATSGRRFRTVDGTLASTRVTLAGGSGLTIDQVRLARSSSNMTAVATLDVAAAARLIEAAFAEAGVDVSGVELGAGTVAFQIFGTRAEVPIGVEDGAIVLIDPFGTGPFEIVTPGENDGWRFTGVVVSGAGMTIDAALDVERLLNPA